MLRHVVTRYPALAYPLYRRYWFASFASVGATQLVTLGQGWLVFELSGSALDLGLLGAAASVPNIVVSLLGGALADRFDKRRILLVSSLLTAALLGLLAVLDATGRAAVWHVLTVAGLVSVITGIEWPTRQALFPHLIRRDGLLSAVALNSFIWQATRMMIPAGGGVLIALSDTWFVFALAAWGYVTMYLVMLTIRVPLPRNRVGSTVQQVVEGVRFIAGHELFRWLILLSYTGMFFGNAYMQLMPAFAGLLAVDETGYGLLLSATGVGSVVGTLAVGAFQHTRHVGLVLLGGALTSALCLYGFAAAVTLELYAAALLAVFCVAAASSVFMVMSMTVLQLAVPDALRGRVMGIHTITYSLMPLGGLFLGAFAERVSAVAGVMLGASAFFAITLGVALGRRAIRDIDSSALDARA